MLRIGVYEKHTGKLDGFLELAPDGSITVSPQPGEEEGLRRLLELRHDGEDAEAFLRRLVRHLRGSVTLEDDVHKPQPATYTPMRGHFTQEVVD